MLLPKVAAAAGADSPLTLAADGSSASYQGWDLAATGFMRANSGTHKVTTLADGKQANPGYRYPVSAKGALCAVVSGTAVIVYLPAASAQLSRTSDGATHSGKADQKPSAKALSDFEQTALKATLEGLDGAASSATSLQSLGLPFVFTDAQRFRYHGLTCLFDQQVEAGSYYVVLKGSASDLEQVQFVDSCLLEPAAQVQVAPAPTGPAALGAFLSSVDLRPLWVSLRTSLAALVLIFVLGLLAAKLTLRVRHRLRAVLDSLFTIPMVLPPTVCGFLLLVVFGNSTPFGRWLEVHGIELVFTWPAAVLAATVVGFPLMFRTVRGAFESLDANLFAAARTLGWGEWRIFLRLMLPLAWPSIAAGTVLAFARALGEFGATLFVAGNYAGVTQTIPIALYYDWMGGDSLTAVFWVVVIILISFVVIALINWYASHSQKWMRPALSGSDLLPLKKPAQTLAASPIKKQAPDGH
ncbi:MAG: molybdate ABC transporter permease subunit [Coriobacteriales bacterium]|nr:molybdate ABC transporter permease subunit [Coriobacteriales bacterium]